jgi:hypothetical protein
MSSIKKENPITASTDKLKSLRQTKKDDMCRNFKIIFISNDTFHTFYKELKDVINKIEDVLDVPSDLRPMTKKVIFFHRRSLQTLRMNYKWLCSSIELDRTDRRITHGLRSVLTKYKKGDISELPIVISNSITRKNFKHGIYSKICQYGVSIRNRISPILTNEITNSSTDEEFLLEDKTQKRVKTC